MTENELNTIEITNQDKRAVFVQTTNGWKPDWFYTGQRPMLRFKDHEWLSIGHVHPRYARSAERLRDGGVEFSGSSPYGDTTVEWTVRVGPYPGGTGFVTECEFTPKESIELLEAYSTFETPYEYDGEEHVTTVIGQNPVVRWHGSERITPPTWKHPAWRYARQQAARRTGPCNTPLLCHTVANPNGSNARYTTIVGDWNVCTVRDVFVTPTRSVDASIGDWGALEEADLRGYKFIVGALNWSSSFTKDPNVFYQDGEKHRQRLIIDFDSDMPGGSLDRMLFQGWERAAALDLPADGRLEAHRRAQKRDVTWRQATSWLEDVFSGDGAEGLYLPDKGIATYAVGTRPKAGHYNWRWWSQWSGPFHYRALLLGDDSLRNVCLELDEEFADQARDMQYHGGNIAIRVSVLPALHWIAGPGKEGILAEALRPATHRALEASIDENDGERQMDNGAQAATAEGFLLAAQAYDEPAFAEQAEILLDEINTELDGAFWAFNCGERGNLMHGGQIRPFGHGCAVLANLLAYHIKGGEDYLEAARRFARYLVSINYVTHNASPDPDFDWRGWANGSNAGRDQIAEFPPWETLASLMRIAVLMDPDLAGNVADGMESGFHDVLWYIARTGLAQFPAARELKRGYDERMRQHFMNRDELASERDFYDILPYLAYENPHDQTLLASYQGTDCLLAELLFGGRLAVADDPRLNVLVPRTVVMDPSETTHRRVCLWNPTAEAIETKVIPRWADESGEAKAVTVPSRESVRVEFEK